MKFINCLELLSCFQFKFVIIVMRLLRIIRSFNSFQLFLSVLITVGVFCPIIFRDSNEFQETSKISKSESNPEKILKGDYMAKKPEIVLVISACSRFYSSQAKALVKSAILATPKSHCLKIVVLGSTSARRRFDVKLRFYRAFRDFDYEIKNADYPSSLDITWTQNFKRCSSLRLFLPSILPEYNKVLYLDADTVVLAPFDEIFEFFKMFNSSQLMGLSQESETTNSKIFNENAEKHPYYGKSGLNTGVALMALAKMRENNFEKEIVEIFSKYRDVIKHEDQDLLNIYFAIHPDKVFVIPCEFNFRTDHCSKSSACSAEKGIKIIHGNRLMFNYTLFGSQIFSILQHQYYDVSFML